MCDYKPFINSSQVKQLLNAHYFPSQPEFSFKIKYNSMIDNFSISNFSIESIRKATKMTECTEIN